MWTRSGLSSSCPATFPTPYTWLSNDSNIRDLGRRHGMGARVAASTTKNIFHPGLSQQHFQAHHFPSQMQHPGGQNKNGGHFVPQQFQQYQHKNYPTQCHGFNQQQVVNT
jgi:hypothetical protein